MKSIFFATVALLLSYSNIFAQDLFTIEKGQFVEQVYGSKLLEEGKDIIDFNNNHLMAGWIELEFEEETTSIDASLWFISNLGEELLHQSYGQIEYAEIGEGAATDGEFIYLAIRQTQESTMDENVSNSDSLIVLGLDEDGVTQWTYKTGIEEGGIAPKDIIIDSDGNIAVLANILDRRGLPASMVIKLSPSGNLLLRSNAYYGQSAEGTTSYEITEYENGYYYTICNDVTDVYPISLLFDMYNATNLSASAHTSLENKYLYGFTYTNNKDVFAAGYSVTEGDTDAFVVQIDSNLTVASTKRHGLEGTEKLVDIGESQDGFVAGGVANNQGEGGWDNYIIHLNSTATTVTLTETMGSEQDETSNHMRILKSDPKVYFPGMTLGFEERFGNASISGTLSHPQGPIGANCNYPRVAYVDGLFNFVTSGVGKGNISGTKSLLTDKTAIINMAHKYNIDYVILYEVDRLFNQWAQTGYHAYDQASIATYPYPDKPVLEAMNYLVHMLLEAHKDPNGIVFGMAIGGNQDFVTNTIGSINNVFNGLTNFNAHHAGKITMAVLEWEIWNLPGGEIALESVTVENAFRNSPRVQAIYPNFPLFNPANENYFYSEAVNPPQGVNLSNPQKQELVSAYNFKLWETRIKYLKQLKIERNRNANLKAIMDYIPYLTSNTPAVTTFYSSFNENVSSASAGTPILEQQFRDNMAEKLLKTAEADVDAVLLAHYFDPGTNQVISYDLGGSNEFAQNYNSLATVSGEVLKLIPLFSAEMTNGCYYDQGFFGNWLGGTNTPTYAEGQFTDQLWSTYGALWGTSRPNCPTCYSNTEIKGFGWYILNCLDDNQLNHQTTFTNFGLSNCNGTGSHVINVETENSQNTISIFPNPASESFQVNLGTHFIEGEYPNITVFDLNGRIVYSKKANADQIKINIESLSPGTYIVKVDEQAFKLIKS